MLRIGIVGVGFMGMIHYLAYQKVRGAKVAAISTRDAKKLAGDWRGIKGNFGPPGTIMDLAAVRGYADWRELLKDPAIDLVDLCLPPSLHAQVAVAALAAGKHVLCEKPLALTVAEGQKMVQAARRAGRLLMTGQVLPFFPEYAFVRKLVAGGRYGKILGGHFRRIISDPLWVKDFFEPRGAGGPVVDLHIHDAHFMCLLCGMPTTVFSTGRWRGDVVEFVNSQFLYDDGPTFTAASGVINQQARSFTHGFELHLQRATIEYQFAVVEDKPMQSVPLTIYSADGKATRPELPQKDAFELELSAVVASVRRGKAAPELSGELALDALRLCHRQSQSVRTGRLVKV